MTWLEAFKRIVRDRRGAVAVEFAILGPTLLTMMFFVVQVGFGMQNYNAMRSIASDVQRYAAVKYQASATGRPTNAQLQTYAATIATATPYNLKTAQFAATVVNATSRVTGATELTLTITYNVPIISMIKSGTIPMTYTRPIFLTT
jgi:Flp pilus assembly protein TadG